MSDHKEAYGQDCLGRGNQCEDIKVKIHADHVGSWRDFAVSGHRMGLIKEAEDIIRTRLWKVWLPCGLVGKESACNVGIPRFNPWAGKILWRRKWQPTPLFLPGEFHGKRSLVGYTPWGHKQSDMTEWLSLHGRFGVPGPIACILFCRLWGNIKRC